MAPKTKPTSTEREEILERFEALQIAKIRLSVALAQAREAYAAVDATGLAPVHILEPLRTVVTLIEQSHARVSELLTRVPL